jgi:DNA (cytosine-5)-methyltransferase 1
MSLTVASFFSGAMGLDLGLEDEGFNTVFACEFDKWAQATIKKNRPELPLLSDIRDFDLINFQKLVGNSHIDVVAGGPPCQAFSTAGKRRGFEDERGNVFLKFLEVIELVRPSYFIIENVRGLLSTKYELDEEEFIGYGLPHSLLKKPGSALIYTCKRLEQSGYSVNFNLYNSANFGVPQKRERVVIIGALSERRVDFLTPTHSENGEFGLSKWTNLRSAFNGLRPENDSYLPLSQKTLKFLQLLKPGQYWKDLPIELQKEAMGGSFHLQGGKTGFYRRLDFNKPSPTVVTSPNMPATLLGHPIENRPLSVKEYARIQQFPDKWEICGSIVNQYKQIGNAVPVGLGRAIGKAILNHLNQSEAATFENFKFSRYRNTSYQELMQYLSSQFSLF